MDHYKIQLRFFKI